MQAKSRPKRRPRRTRRIRDILKSGARRRFRGHPVATIAYYGPDDKLATKVAVGILEENDQLVALRRWYSEEQDIRFDQGVNQQILEFIQKHEAQSVAMPDRIIGCAHEEGIDYPEGEVCPQCPFWANRDRWTGEVIR